MVIVKLNKVNSCPSKTCDKGAF